MATYDLLTLTEARDALSQDPLSTGDEEILKGYITAISTRLDEVCGPIVQRTITDELHDGGNSRIWLKNTPVVSITTITEYSDTTGTVLTEQTPTVHTDYNYIKTLSTGLITRTQSGAYTYFEPGVNNIKVTYVAGRYENTNEVAALFKIAAGAFLAHVWKMNKGMGSDIYGSYDAGTPIITFALPKRVIDLLGTEIKPGPIA